MIRRSPSLGAAAAPFAVVVLACTLVAQEPEGNTERLIQELQRDFERRLSEMRAAYEGRIEALEGRVGELTIEALDRQDRSTESEADARLQEALDEVLKLQEAVVQPQFRGAAPLGRIGSLQLLDLSLDILFAAGTSSERDDALSTLQGGGHDPRKRGFTVQNVELSMVGAVDPYFTGEMHLVAFIDPFEGETEVELEEAFLLTRSLPFGLQVEAGTFFTEFGRINPRHPHAWDFLDQPVINSRFFGPDGLRGPGLRVGWLTPLPWFSELHLGAQNANGETMASFLANDEFFEERPVGGRPFVDRDVRSLEDILYLVRWDNGWDLSEELGIKAGVSALFGPNATGRDGATGILGVDFLLRWRPANAFRGWPFFIWQSEFMFRRYTADNYFDPRDPDDPKDDLTIRGDKLDDWGFYTQFLYGFSHGWVGGLRYEFASGSGSSFDLESEAFISRRDDPFRDDRHRLSALLVYHPSEFSRLRLQYNWDVADHLDHFDAHTVWLGVEILFGQHPAHDY